MSSEAVVKVSNNKIATIAKHNNAYKSASFFCWLAKGDQSEEVANNW